MTGEPREHNPLDDYAATRIFRRCGQLGIPYADAIESSYGHRLGWHADQFKIQYRDGVSGTTGWVKKERELEPKDVVPFEKADLERLLGIAGNVSRGGGHLG